MTDAPYYQPIARSGEAPDGTRWQVRKGSWAGVEMRDGPASAWTPGFAIRRARGKRLLVPITPNAHARRDAEAAALWGQVLRKLRRELADVRLDNRWRNIAYDADVEPDRDWIDAVPELAMGHVCRPLYEEVLP